MKTSRFFLSAVFSVSILCSPQRASAFDIVLDPSNLAQAIAQVALLKEMIENEVNMIANQVQQLENDARNLASLEFSAIQEYTSDLQSLFETLGTIEGLIQHLSELESKFEEFYPDLSIESDPIASASMAADMHSRLQRTRDMIKGSLKTSAKVLENMPKSQEHLTALMENSQLAEGILQAAQAGNQIAGDIAAQIISLNAQLGSYIQAHTAQLMEKNGAALAAKNRLDHVMEDWLTPGSAQPAASLPTAGFPSGYLGAFPGNTTGTNPGGISYGGF